MGIDISQFVCRVPAAGYEVARGGRRLRAQPEELSWFVTKRSLHNGRRTRTREVRPFAKGNKRALYREFACLSPSHEEIVEFANRFGLLGGDFKVSCWLNVGPAEDAFEVCELVVDWYDEIRAMRLATDLWACVRKGDRKAAATFLVAQAEIAKPEPGSLGWPFNAAKHPFAPRTLQELASTLVRHKGHTASDEDCLGGRDPLTAAMECLVETVNWRLLPGLRAGLSTVTERKRAEARAQLHLTPDSLGQAIWFQFALDVLGVSSHPECEHCGIWFAVPIKHYGRPSRYCSESCRLKAYRHRQVEARRQREEGASYEEIARRLGSDPETVRGWIER